jgi:hypothetical protein
MKTPVVRATADASSVYRERASIEVARSYSSSDTGNLAAVTKNATFEVSVVQEAQPAPAQTRPTGTSCVTPK